ncbi:hypothetical protein QYF36_016865 [Acer negundo]|nr:hypothetical protein QYF36_016865 [Acer negundo]
MFVVQWENGRDEGSTDLDSSLESSTHDNRLRDGIEKGMLLPLGENELAKIREINWSVVLPIPPPKMKRVKSKERAPPPKMRKVKSKGMVSKMHGTRTRRDKRKDPEVIDIIGEEKKPKEQWNLELEITKVVEKGAEQGFEFNFETKSTPKT